MTGEDHHEVNGRGLRSVVNKKEAIYSPVNVMMLYVIQHIG